MLGRKRAMGEPATGPHGRTWVVRRRRLTPEEGPPEPEEPEPAEERIRPTGFPLRLVGSDEIALKTWAHALEVVERVSALAPRRVLAGRLTLEQAQDPAVERPAVVKVTLDVGGRPVRAHVAGRELDEAIDLLESRLRRNLRHLAESERARRRKARIPLEGEWSHGDLATARPSWFPRPVEERKVRRRKTYALAELLPEEAALELSVLDYDFHLFSNRETAEENVVYRRSDGTLGLLQPTPGATARPVPFEADPAPVPVLLLEDAVERLNLGGERFLFFVDGQERRGRVLYRRYDGHYGLIEPA
jgi:hypothetical protein